MTKKNRPHLGLTTGTVACSGRLTASYPTDEVTEDWTEVKCPRCRKTEFYQYRIAQAEKAERKQRCSRPPDSP